MYDILPTDRMFLDSPQPGPDCICSRCGLPITEGIPIRAWPDDIEKNAASNYEYRYHPGCVGVYMADEIDFDIQRDDLNDEFNIPNK